MLLIDLMCYIYLENKGQLSVGYDFKYWLDDKGNEYYVSPKYKHLKQEIIIINILMVILLVFITQRYYKKHNYFMIPS